MTTPHGGALRTASAPSTGITAARAALRSNGPAGHRGATAAADHAPRHTVNPEAAYAAHQRRHTAHRPTPSPAPRLGSGDRTGSELLHDGARAPSRPLRSLAGPSQRERNRTTATLCRRAARR